LRLNDPNRDKKDRSHVGGDQDPHPEREDWRRD
jgi:hypothetical protein